MLLKKALSYSNPILLIFQPYENGSNVKKHSQFLIWVSDGVQNPILFSELNGYILKTQFRI